MALVLLVDDDGLGLEIRKLVLERAGHQVIAVVDPQDARAKCRDTAPDSVVLDLRLPGAADGLALIRDLRRAAPHVRIIVLSGWCSDLDGRNERHMVDEILSKPVAPELLIRAITPGCAGGLAAGN